MKREAGCGYCRIKQLRVLLRKAEFEVLKKNMQLSARSLPSPGRLCEALICFAFGLCSATLLAQPPAISPSNQTESSIDGLIPWLLREDHELREIPFSKVIADATGKRVLAIDPKNEVDERVIKCICEVLDEVIKRMNAARSSRDPLNRQLMDARTTEMRSPAASFPIVSALSQPSVSP